MITDKQIAAAMRDSFFAATAAANPQNFMRGALPPLSDLFPAHKKSKNNIIVIAAGKAAGGMAQAAEAYYPPEMLKGCVIIPHKQTPPPLSCLDVLHAAHPLPDKHSVIAANTALHWARTANKNDVVLVLLSGGASSLLGAPMDGLTLDALRNISHQLLNAAADVREINIVRRQLSLAAGGRLAAASCAPVYALICSDVLDGKPSDIASGPCAVSPTTAADALMILNKYNVAQHFAAVCLRLQKGEFDLPLTSALSHTTNNIICDSLVALAAGEQILIQHGIPTINWGEQTAPVQTLACNHLNYLRQQEGVVALLSGGEGLAAVKGDVVGMGGRNTAFALHAWVESDIESLSVLSCDTDGIDGGQDAAGALWMPHHRQLAMQQNLVAQDFLLANNSGDFFRRLDALIYTKPTGANVSDYRVLVCHN